MLTESQQVIRASQDRGWSIYDESGCEVYRESIFLGRMTNNVAEYEALLLALDRLRGSSVKDLHVYTDSLLVANQVIGKYKINNTELLKYVRSAKTNNLDVFDTIYFKRIKHSG